MWRNAPRWNNRFLIKSQMDTILLLKVYDKDAFSDDFVGAGSLDLETVSKSGRFVSYNVPIYFYEKIAGFVQLDIQYI